MDTAYKEKVTKILTAAAAAPSGDNSQPWRFVVQDSSIEFYALPEKDNPILNYKEGGTLIALGAALQNAELEARAQGYVPHTVLHEDGSCVAVMELKVGGRLDKTDEFLQKSIFKRHTNRKPYKKVPLSKETRTAILDSFLSERTELDFSLIESRDSMSEVAKALTVMEEVALGNHTLHKLFFENIFWSEKENRSGKQGLYIKTLELPPPAQILFRLLKHWSFAKLFTKIGFSQIVAKTNAQQNAAASALGVITAPHTDRVTYLEIGKALERIWLLATARGLSMQIVTGITFLVRSMENNSAIFSESEKERVRAAYMIIKNHVNQDHEPVLVFRIGVGNEPTAVTYRHRTPDIVFV